jgi:hypothetical protein
MHELFEPTWTYEGEMSFDLDDDLNYLSNFIYMHLNRLSDFIICIVARSNARAFY